VVAADAGAAEEIGTEHTAEDTTAVAATQEVAAEAKDTED